MVWLRLNQWMFHCLYVNKTEVNFQWTKIIPQLDHGIIFSFENYTKGLFTSHKCTLERLSTLRVFLQYQCTWTLITLWANSTDDKLMIFFQKTNFCSGKIRKIYQNVVCWFFWPRVLSINFQQTTFWNIFLIFPGNRIRYFVQIISNGDNLHEMLTSVFWKKKIRKVSSVCCLLKLTRERWASIFSRRHFEYFSYFSKETRIWHFMQIVSNRDSLHEMPNSVGWKKYEKYHRICLLKLPTEW